MTLAGDSRHTQSMRDLEDILSTLPALPEGQRWQLVPVVDAEKPLRVEIQEPDGPSWRAVRSDAADLDTGAIQSVAVALAGGEDPDAGDPTPTADLEEPEPLSCLFPPAPEGLRWQVVPTGVDTDPLRVELQEPAGPSWNPVASVSAILAIDALRTAAEKALRIQRGIPELPDFTDAQAIAWVDEVTQAREKLTDDIPFDPQDSAWWIRRSGEGAVRTIDALYARAPFLLSVTIDENARASVSASRLTAI